MRRSALTAVLSASLVACGVKSGRQGDYLPPGPSVEGPEDSGSLVSKMIVRPVLDDPTRRIVFMGFSDDLQAELERVLAGLPTDTHWARIELPTAMLEQAKGIYRCHDLARTEDVQLFQRSDEGIYEMDSGAEQFEWGTLLLVGPGYLESTGCSPWAIDEEGQPWTISFDYSWHGPVLRDDGERESMGVTGSFGGAATHVCMGGGLCPHEM